MDELAPIGLDELVDRAGLLTRVDRKYLLPVAVLPQVLAGLPAGTRVLRIDRRQRFRYRSAYLDTPGLDSYLTTAHRRRRRFKVRIRSYLDSGTHFLETKTRGPRGTTVKTRFPYEGGRTHLDPDMRDLAVAALADAGVAAEGFRFDLALTTAYERTTLFLPSTSSRVTIDEHLTWTLPGGPALTTPGRVIVETKSGRSTSPVDRLLWSLSHRPCPVSKYATGLAALRPDLPANRWRSVLRRHFESTAAAERC
ncbi:VTC domain-containing protein [Actinoplanes sp. LDG1-06]|uniref:VTC domain-containing protein n=1 Tax=Paractinoplanes ovalisporus TaxID=2810368 RepID=A0ABS2AI00_9ACTN|nr:VTC domain-containing protein [Actinoplanes ovalisporus]